MICSCSFWFLLFVVNTFGNGSCDSMESLLCRFQIMLDANDFAVKCAHTALNYDSWNKPRTLRKWCHWEVLWLLIAPWKVALQCQCSWQLLHGHVMKSNNWTENTCTHVNDSKTLAVMRAITFSTWIYCCQTVENLVVTQMELLWQFSNKYFLDWYSGSFGQHYLLNKVVL